MSGSSELLLDRAVRYLMDVAHEIEAPLTREGTRTTPDAARELGLAQFSQVGGLLKTALDIGDARTFEAVDAEWSELFEDVLIIDLEGEDGDSSVDLDVDQEAPTATIRQLVRYREVLRMGLAMWAAHILERPPDEARQQQAAESLRILAGHFEGIGKLFDAFERASDSDDRGRTDWSSWFLAELPARQAHFIPTSSKLLLATLLMATLLLDDRPVGHPPARDWLDWRFGEITEVLDQLERDASKWGELLSPVTSPELGTNASAHTPAEEWRQRISRLRELLTVGHERTLSQKRQRVRESTLDPDRVDEFRRNTLDENRKARLLRDTFELHGGLSDTASGPTDAQARVFRTWIPKSFFTPDSRVVGLDMAARDLGRVTANTEVQDLLAALPTREPTAIEGHPRDAVDATLATMRGAGLRPSLIALPVGWELERALGLSALGGLVPASHHPLIPVAHARRFDGIIDDVPAIAFPQLDTDSFWILDLARAARFIEWPSDGESGVRFQLQEFDGDAAAALLEEQPTLLVEEASREEAIDAIRERVLLTLSICWTIRPGSPEAAIRLTVPEALRRDHRSQEQDTKE